MANAKKIKQPLSKGAAKVPVVMQMEALECGAASLTMVLAYYGKWIPLEQARTAAYPAMAPMPRMCCGLPAAMASPPRATAWSPMC